MGDRLAVIDMDRKVKGAAVPPFLGGGAGSPSNNVAWAEAYLRTKWHLDPCSRLATIHQRHRQTDRQTGQGDRQRPDSNAKMFRKFANMKTSIKHDQMSIIPRLGSSSSVGRPLHRKLTRTVKLLSFWFLALWTHTRTTQVEHHNHHYFQLNGHSTIQADSVNVLHPTRHKIGHFGNALHRQSPE